MLKSKFIRRKSRSKSAGQQRQRVSTVQLIDPPKEFCNDQTDQTEFASTPAASEVQTEDIPDIEMRNKRERKGSFRTKRDNNSDDYGFLTFNRSDSNGKQPRITVRVNSPQPEVDYFDESLFDIGYLQAAGERDSIPVTLGSISSVISSNNSNHTDTNSEMPIQVPPLPAFCLPKHQQDQQKYAKENNSFYEEKMEGHYARLSEVNVHSMQPKSLPPSSKNSTKGELNFYVQKAAEQRSRSRSRGPTERATRGRSRSAHSTQARSRSRGCSASRDIMALYTNRPVPGCKINGRPESPELNSPGHRRRRQSRSPESRNSRGSTRSTTAFTESVKTKVANQSSRPDFFNGYTKSDNNPLRSRQIIGSTNTSTPTQDTRDGTSSMTILEMDVEKNTQIEKDLLAANSLKPANIKMMMIAHHAPSTSWASKDEVSVKAGDIVTGIYKQNEWLYVMNDSREFGFVPYAFTKPVKVTSSTAKSTAINVKPPTKPVNGILKTSNYGKQKSRKSHPKYSVKVRTAADTDSLSSESSSAIVEDFVYTRKKGNNMQSHADCIVIDTDDICPSFDSPLHREETGTYCSDSGISDPSSNHSEDQDFLHSPISYVSDSHNDSGLSTSLSTPRLPNERVVSVTTEILANNSSLPIKRDSLPKVRYHGCDTISDMPLGPLGARLAKLNLEKNRETKPSHSSAVIKSSCKLGNDTRERAKSSSNTPSSLRPEIPKDYNGPRATVVFDYDGGNEDDVVVHASDIVTVLNSEDIEWIWVQRRDGKEGFIPREYVIPLELAAQNRRRIGISLL